MIYRVHTYTDAEGSEGYRYCASRAAANAALRRLVEQGYEKAIIECWETPKTKKDVIKLLSEWASHPNNG